MTDTANIDVNVDQKLKEAYFTASQGQLIWTRFKKQKAAMVGLGVLAFLILSGLFAPFLTPYDPTIAGRNENYLNGAPNIPSFCDDNGCSLRPFIYSYERSRSIKTNFRWVTEIDTSLEARRYVVFFTQGDEYTFLGIKFSTHLFGVDKGKIHIFGTDSTGKDIYARTLHAINTSLAVGLFNSFLIASSDKPPAFKFWYWGVLMIQPSNKLRSLSQGFWFFQWA